MAVTLRSTKGSLLVHDELDDNFKFLLAVAGTGFLTGGQVTINGGDNTKFDVAAGSGTIIDNTNPSDPVLYQISWDAFSAQSVTNLATEAITFISINQSGTLVQENLPPDTDGYRDRIQLGAINHSNNTTITSASDFTTARPFDLAVALTELMDSLGPVNVSGNVISGTSSAMTLEKSVGQMMFVGVQRDPRNPNYKDNPALSAPNIIQLWRDGSGGWSSSFNSTVEAGAYDNNSGDDVSGDFPDGSVGVPQWVNHRIQYSPDSGDVVMHYGQNTYGNSADAIAAIKTESFVPNPAAALVPYRAVLTVKGDATDLNDVADAIFTPASKIGEF